MLGSASPVRVNFSVRLAAHRLSVDALTLSPTSVPSGCGSKVKTTQISDAASAPQSDDASPTAIHLPPTRS